MSNRDGPDRWMSALALIGTIRGVMGTPESTIRTQEDVKDRGRASREAWANLVLGGIIIVGGLAAHAWGWSEATGLDATARGGILGILAYLLFLLVPTAFLARRFAWPMFTTYLWALATTWLLTFFILVLIAPRYEQRGIIASLIGLVFALASMPFIYNNYKELKQPYWRRSPYEEEIARTLFPGMAAMFEGEGGHPRRLTVPYRINGILREPTPYARQDGDAFIVDLHPLDLALVEFIQEAERRGLARANWIRKKQPNYILPRSNVEITRDMYDDMIRRLVEWDMIRPGGGGQAAQWRINPRNAIELFNRHIREQLAEEPEGT